MTFGQRSNSVWKRAVVAAAMMGALFALLVPSSASGATTLHTFSFKGNMPDGFGNGLAIETHALVQFSCNPSTGHFSIRITNFSVIDQNNIAMQWDSSRTPTRVIAVGIDNGDIENSFNLPITQSTTSELYKGSQTGYLDPASALCATGDNVRLVAIDGTPQFDAYQVHGTMN